MCRKTHNIALTSPIAAFVLSMASSGRMQTMGSPSDVLGRVPELAQEFAQEMESLDMNEGEEVLHDTGAVSAKESKLVVAEEIALGNVSWSACALSKFFISRLTHHIGNGSRQALPQRLERWAIGLVLDLVFGRPCLSRHMHRSGDGMAWVVGNPVCASEKSPGRYTFVSALVDVFYLLLTGYQLYRRLFRHSPCARCDPGLHLGGVPVWSYPCAADHT